MTHLSRRTVGILHARKGKRTVAKMIERPMLNSRTIFDYLNMATDVIPNLKQNY